MRLTSSALPGLQGAQDAKISSLAVAASRLELAALPLEDAAFAPLAEGNHKLALTAGLIKVGAWQDASRMLVWLGSLGAPAAAHPAVRAALCRLLSDKLEPFHTWLLQHGLCSSASQVWLPL